MTGRSLQSRRPGSPPEPRDFSLVPFRGGEYPSDLAITGTIGRSADALSMRCVIAGDLSSLAVPPAAPSPERKGRLWEETCIELFLGVKGSVAYWEIHISPAGHWNVYRFASYREGRREEPAFSSLPFGMRSGHRSLRLSMELELGKFLPAAIDAEIGICAVIKTKTGGTSHWALAHPGTRPDFHRREGFALTLPGE